MPNGHIPKSSSTTSPPTSTTAPPTATSPPTPTNSLNTKGAQFYIKSLIGLYISSNGLMEPINFAEIFTVESVDKNGNLILYPQISVEGGEPGIATTSYPLTISPGPPDIVAVHNSPSGDFLVNISNSISSGIIGYYTLNTNLATCIRVPVTL